MEIVITMAGEGSRFKKVGYNIPKYQIEVKGKTLFEWSMLSLKKLINENSKFTFIVRKFENINEFINEQCEKLGIKHFKIIAIDYLTQGQASTALLASNSWNKKEELLIYNIDTFVEPNYINLNDFKGDGFLHCFHAEGEHWSFVKLNEYGNAIQIAEKERISNNCSIGSYYFKSCELFETTYRDFYEFDLNNTKEKYIAPMYNYLISKNKKVKIKIIPAKFVHVLGTPEEVDYFTKNYKN